VVAHRPPAPDRGLARERTALVCNRSGLAVVVCIAVLVRHLWPIEGTGRDIAVCLIAAAVVWSIVVLAFARTSAERAENTFLGARLFGFITAAMLLLAICASCSRSSPSPNRTVSRRVAPGPSARRLLWLSPMTEVTAGRPTLAP
jgi:hypothetical protein